MRAYRLLFYFLLPVLLSALQAKASEEERAFTVIKASNGLADNSAQVVTCTPTGRIIISTIGNLNFFDGKSFTPVESRIEYEYVLPKYLGHYHLYFDNDNHIWLKDKRKVTCLDLQSENFVSNPDSVIRKMGCSEPVLDLFVDQYGYMWFVTSKGLYSNRYHRFFQMLRERSLQDLDAADGITYTFYDNGEVVGIDSLGNTTCQAKAYEWTKGQQYASSSVLRPYGNGIFQIRNGDGGAILLYFDLTTKSFETILEKEHHLNNMTLDPEEKTLYVPSEYGYYTYNPSTKEINHYPEVLLKDGQTMGTDCNAMTFDHQGGLWVGTEKRGVLYARPHSLAFRSYPWGHELATKYGTMLSVQSENVSISEYAGVRANCMLPSDSRGWKWIGTRRGLYIERPGNQETLHYSRKEGLNNGVVRSIIEDQDHNMWIATSSGITFFLIQDGNIVFINNFTSEDNVPDESFENCKVLMTPDGTIAMQSVEHVLLFNPQDLKDANEPHVVTNIKPRLVRMLMNGDDVFPGKEYDGLVIVDRAMSCVDHINLKSDQNSITLTFSALNYYRPIQTYYRVRVKELGNKWEVFSCQTSSQVDSRGLLHYPMVNLQPGEYHVEVQASLFPNRWEENLSDSERFVWTIQVNEPWWRTTGLYVLLISILVILLIVNFVLYSRNIRMRVRRISEEGDIIRKICYFAERCNSFAAQNFMPVSSDRGGTTPSDSENTLSPEFVVLMLKLLPFINSHQERQLTMKQLSEAADMEIVQFYTVVMANLYKSPRELARIMKLQKAEELLRTTNDNIEQIAMMCKFYTPNYFIGNFFHQYKMTPREYREKVKQP